MPDAFRALQSQTVAVALGIPASRTHREQWVVAPEKPSSKKTAAGERSLMDKVLRRKSSKMTTSHGAVAVVDDDNNINTENATTIAPATTSDATSLAPSSISITPSMTSLLKGRERHRLLRTGDFSDCTVVCNGHEWKLHKAVICYRSEFFMKALTGEMREGQTGIVVLSQEPALDDVHRMIRFFYEHDYRREDKPTRAMPARAQLVRMAVDELWVDIRMYSMGQRYMSVELMNHALSSFTAGLQNEMLFPVQIIRVNPATAVQFIKANNIDTVVDIIEIATRCFLQGEDLSGSHKAAMFDLCYRLYPALVKFEKFREALTGDLSELAGMILVKVTQERPERMAENCEGCNVDLGGQPALELISYCSTCKEGRRQEGARIMAGGVGSSRAAPTHITSHQQRMRLAMYGNDNNI